MVPAATDPADGSDLQEDLTARVLEALADGDRAALQRLLHPYLHWTVDGTTTRGRNQVLALLERTGADASHRPPVSVDLRDQQVYRWTVGPVDGA